jgi:hypothetical protein
MAKKLKTMELQGKAYAKVPERIKLFREENIRGLIEISTEIMGDYMVFKARILKDKSDPSSAESTGQSMVLQKDLKTEKKFEKQETIAVGRALANLGYMASGEVASYEEMEEFEEHKQEKFMEEMGEHADAMQNAKNLKDLQQVWLKIPSTYHQSLNDLKNELKVSLNENNKNGTGQPRVAGVAKRKNNGK